MRYIRYEDNVWRVPKNIYARLMMEVLQLGHVEDMRRYGSPVTRTCGDYMVAAADDVASKPGKRSSKR